MSFSILNNPTAARAARILDTNLANSAGSIGALSSGSRLAEPTARVAASSLVFPDGLSEHYPGEPGQSVNFLA